jgi:hypothetical protein
VAQEQPCWRGGELSVVEEVVILPGVVEKAVKVPCLLQVSSKPKFFLAALRIGPERIFHIFGGHFMA